MIAINTGRKAGKTYELLREAYDRAKLGDVVLIAGIVEEFSVVMLNAKRYRELVAAEQAGKRGEP